MRNLVIYDYLSFTTKLHSPDKVVNLLGLEKINWVEGRGAHGYRERWFFESISIHYDGREDMGVWCEMTGKGCRAFESYGNGDYEALFELILSETENMNLTRLDAAYDDHDGILDIVKLCEDTRKQEFVSRFNDWQVIEGSKGCSVTHGSMKSDIFLRIYDKAAEQGLEDGSHWIRVELQMRRERASAFVGVNGAIGLVFCGVLLNYLRYVEPDAVDTNRWRWPLKDYWSDLMEDACKIQLYQKPGVDYNPAVLQDYVIRQCGNAIDAYIKICGINMFLDKLRNRGTMPNQKYISLIEMYAPVRKNPTPPTAAPDANGDTGSAGGAPLRPE